MCQSEVEESRGCASWAVTCCAGWLLWAGVQVNGHTKNSQYGRARLGAGPERDVCQVKCDSHGLEHGHRVYCLSW